MYCIITGATKGIGRAVAEMFAQRGSNLMLIARDRNDLEALQTHMQTQYPAIEALIFAVDLSQPEAVKDLGKTLQALNRPLSVLVNNAGIFLPGRMLEEADGILEQQMNLNLYSAFHLTRLVAPTMIRQGKGHIFNIGSVASLRAYADSGSYTITKFAMLGFSRALRLELLHTGVKVTTVLPGPTYTHSWIGTPLPPERFIAPEEVAQTIWNAWNTGPSVCIEEILMRPLAGDL